MKIINSKLIFLLNSFSKHDIREFKKMVSSNFFSKGRNYLSILNHLLKYREKDFKGFTSQKFYSKLYPGKIFRMQTLNNRFSELAKLAEEYLVLKTLKENKSEKEKLLLLAYHKNRIQKLFDKQFPRSKRTIQSFPESDFKFIDMSFLENLNLLNSREQTISDKTYGVYFERSAYITALFLKNLFEFGYEFKQQEQTNRIYEFNLAMEILDRLEMDNELIKKLLDSDSVIFKIVVMEFYFYRVFKYPNEEKNYFEARKIFESLENSLDVNYKIEVFRKMTNYCIMRNNQGVVKFQRELFTLYNERLELMIYLDSNNVFPPPTFRNYVLIGIKLGRKKWTEGFIKKYSKELPEENREDEIKLAYSKLFFSNGNYEKSLQYLTGFKGLNYLHYCDSSLLKLCTYYETQQFEEAFLEIDKFRHYLRNHKEIPKIHTEYSFNFLKIYLQLIKFRTGVDRQNLYQIENLIGKTKLVSRESWLLEKIRELKP